MRLLLTILFVLPLVGCTTTQVSLATSPSGADVFARPIGQGEFVHIGKTPLYVTNRQLQKANGFGAVQIEVRKEGYKIDEFIITEISQVNLYLNRELRPMRDFESQAWLNQSIGQMFEVRQLVQANRYKEALGLIRRLKEQTPMVATLHQLEGGVQLLLRDYAAALAAYRTAARLNPEDAEAVKMIRHLERAYGFRREIDIIDAEALKRFPANSSGEVKP